MKKFFTMAALTAAVVCVNAEVTPRSPIVPWGAQAEIIITNDLTQQNSDGSWSLTDDAQKWIYTTYDGETSTLVQQTNRNNLWFDIYDETTDTMIVCVNWTEYKSVFSKTGASSGLIVVGKNRYPHFFVTGTDKAKFYFSGSASTAGYPQVEVYEVGSETPVATYTGKDALTKKTSNISTLLIADGLDKAKSYEIVCRTMALDAESSTYTYEGGDIVLQVVKFYGDQAPMREDGLIVNGSEIGSYINQHLAAYPDVTEFKLEGSGKYTITEGITAATAISITGEAEAPATIDASALAGTFLSFSGMTKKVLKADESESDYYDVPAVNLKNMTITGLSQSLMGNSDKTMFGKIIVDNANVELIGNKAVFALGNGYPEDLQLTNSTFWSKEGHTGFFFQSSGKAVDIDAEKITSWAVDKCTFFQVSVGKKMNNSNTFKGKAYLHISLTNSILVNTGSNVGNEVNGWLFGQNSTSPTIVYENNTYWKLAAATEEAEAVSEAVAGWTDENKQGSDQTGTSLATEPFTLANALAGNFKLTASSQQAKYMTGDPRWKTPYATEAIKIEVDLSENTDFATVLNEALKVSEQPSSITIQFFEAGEYPLTQAINTTAPITIQNGSDISAGDATIVVNNGMTIGGAIKVDGVNLKAGDELAEPVITLQGNPYQLQDNGFYNLGKIQFLNLKVTNLKTHLLCGAKNVQISEIETKNCEIYMADKIAGSGNTPAIYDFRQGGAVATWNFVNSTLDAVNNAIFSTAGGQKATEAGIAQQTLNISTSTILNPVKKAFQHRQNNQKWLRFILKKSLIVVNGEKPNFVAEMNAGSTGGNPIWDIDGNAFQKVIEGGLEDACDQQNTGDDAEPVKNNIKGAFAFTDMEGGNFGGTMDLAEGIEVPTSLGDPRWVIKYNAYESEPSGEVTYALVEGDAFTSGQVVDVKVDDDVVATIQYGEAGEWDGESGHAYAPFNAAAADGQAAEWGYSAFTSGNGVNGNKPGGTTYTIIPKYSGVIAAAVVLNADKKFHLTIDGEQNPTFDNNTVSEKYYGPISFNVISGKAYKFYCDGSKLGFYGFNYKYGPDVTPITETSVANQQATVGIDAAKTATVNNGVFYNLNGQQVQTLTKGLYIQNGKKFIVK